MNYRPIRIADIKSGDTFFEDASGTMVQCQALENPRDGEVGVTMRASTPLGEREFYEAKGGRTLRLYIEHKPAA